MQTIRETSLSQRASNSRPIGGGIKLGGSRGNFGRGRAGRSGMTPAMSGMLGRPEDGAAPGTTSGLTPGSFGEQNWNANHGIYEPGSFGDQNARANRSSQAPANSAAAVNTLAKAPALPMPQGVAVSTGAEAAMPLSGDGNSEPTGKTTTITKPGVYPGGPAAFGPAGKASGLTPASVAGATQDSLDHGRAMGFSSKGAATAVGTDTPSSAPAGSPGNEGSGTSSLASGFNAGTGTSAKSFSNPTSQRIYADFSKKLFGPGLSMGNQPNSGLRKSRGFMPATNDEEGGGADTGAGA